MWDAFIGLFINVLLFIYQLVGNFGVAIILFTILIRLLTYPLTASQLKSASAMQALQKDKRFIDIQAKYKNDKEKLAQEQMKLYQELKINPLSSCLPTLIQFPLIIALYQSVIRALASTPIELLSLTKAVYPALLKVSNIIPLQSKFLWMDLGQPERLYLPFLSFGIPILAIVVMASTYVQSKLMTPPSTGSGDQSAMMSNMMNLYMPFLMGYLALTLASGLSLYFLVSNLIGIGQYAALGKVNWSNLNPFQKPVAATAGGSGSRQNRPSLPAKQDRPVKSAIQTAQPNRTITENQANRSEPKPFRTGKPGKMTKGNGNSNESGQENETDNSQKPARSVKSKK